MNRFALAVLSLFICVGMVYAACGCKRTLRGDTGKEAINTIASTAQSAADGTANVAKTSVNDTVDAPKTAIQAVKDTANTAFSGADKAIKTVTGEGR